jgi:hypothetical protein
MGVDLPPRLPIESLVDIPLEPVLDLFVVHREPAS